MSHNSNLQLNTQLNIFTDYPDVVSVEQMMNMLHIGKVLAYRLIRDKQIKSKKIGREYKIQKSAVAAYLNETEGCV